MTNLPAASPVFDPTEALRIEIPLLEACYRFAETGNDRPTLPEGLDLVAPIRAEPSDLFRFKELSPHAQAAIAIDDEAMSTDGSGGRLPAPDAYGFVVREGEKTLWVGIRGSLTGDDWTQNVLFVPTEFAPVPNFGLVHLGFEEKWWRIRRQVLEAVARFPSANIRFVGHSLGAAMATLGTVELTVKGGRRTELTTYGSPRTGLIRFHANFERLPGRHFRVADMCDIVTAVPPRIFLYAHVGQVVPVRSKKDRPHAVSSYKHALENFSPLRLDAGFESMRESLRDEMEALYLEEAAR